MKLKWTLVVLAVSAFGSSVSARDWDDNAWVRQTIRQERRETYRRTHPYRPPVYSYQRRHYELPAPVHVEPPSHHRALNVITSGHQKLQRDVLSNVVCMPPIEAVSTEANTEEGAYKDAMRVWENLVRWKMGERFMSISNAAEITRQCSRSSGNQSIVGRAVEAMASAVGQDGFKHRCQIIASPCMAPIQANPVVKND
jgi:hypothetical protein